MSLLLSGGLNFIYLFFFAGVGGGGVIIEILWY